jgi:signal transduction histidine kinase/HPt (histidine-containing phosphotransfer) domain-containing protein
MNQKKDKTPLMSKFVIFSIALFFFILAAGTTTFILSMRRIIRTNKSSELTQIMEIERLKLEIYLNCEISIALKMADSPLIRRYFASPDNPGLKELAFEEIAAYRRAFASNSVFWVSDAERNFYTDDSFSYALDPENPENYWYYMTLYETESYNFNINFNPDLNVTNLWINVPVFDDNRNPLGIVGTGIEISEFINMIYRNYTGSADIYFFNAEWEITGAKDVSLVSLKRKIYLELRNLDIDIFNTAMALKSSEIITLDTYRGKVAIMALPLLDWYSIAVLPNRISDYNGTMVVLFLVMLVVVAVIFIIFNVFISGLLTPLRKSMEEAETANKAKSAFLANMSHEIRTPMNSIMGFSELAMDSETSPKTRDYLDKIQKNAEWLLQIINDILDISKVESGKMELEKIPFDMHELLASCRTLVLPKAAEKGIMLHFYAEPSIGKRPLGDPTRLRQVFLNLLSNAIKFTNLGSVKIYAKIKEKTENTITMCFEIKDSGIGMTSEQIMKVFDPFTQAESSTMRKYGGTGLGLPITKNIVELMGGKLMVESSPGIGSKFSFELTFDTIDVLENDVWDKKIILNEIEKPMFDGEILLCEDNVMNQQVICEHLSRVGIKTIVADNGKIGVDMVRGRLLSGEKQFDLIFMDMHMPIMDGLEASSRIIALNANIPIVAMTANVMSSDREVYKMSGMHDCVGKPFTSQELWRCLLRFLKPINDMDEQNNAQVEAGRLEADREFHKSLQITFAKGNQKKFEEMANAIKAGDIKLAHRLAHTLKGNAGQIGKTGLQQAAADVERQLKDGKNLVTPAQMKTLQIELDAVLTELAPLLVEASMTEAAQVEPVDMKTALELIEKLEPMLKMGNPECLKLIGSLRRIPGSEKLIQQIDDFNFAFALSALAELKEKLGSADD